MNSEEIARLANVSRSTVSRVINNYSNVPEETRRKVMKVIEEYKYVPNSSARNLAGKSNNIITLFIYDEKQNEDYNNRWKGSRSPYYMSMIAELIDAAKEYKYIVSAYIVTSQEDYDFIESMFSFRFISGGIFAGFETQSKQLNRMIKKGFRMVVIDPADDLEKSEKVDFIYNDNGAGGYKAVKYLLEHGHRAIGHITGDERLSSQERERGYCRAMEEAGISIQEGWIRSGMFREKEAYDVAREMISCNKVTAIFAASDVMAISVIRAIWDMGLKVPEDISVIGFDNLDIFTYADLKITSMEISQKELARSIIKRICSKSEEKKIFCPATLIEGETVRTL